MESVSLGSHRLIHLDLKGAPPKLTYLEQLFPLLREWGATGLLLEWEDTFPYSRELLAVGSGGPQPAAGAYSGAEARQLLQLAGDHGLAVVPLVQTFGHLEFVLKHEEWRPLREVEAYPSSMCPSHPRALPLVTSLIKQIVDFHPDIQYLHIGADEVWHMGLCRTCARRVQASKHGRCQLFLEHLVAVAQFIRDTYPSLRIIMWDDMLRPIDTSVLLEYNLGRYVEPMVWHYQTAESFQLLPALWDKYSDVFASVWAATAFKGATGSCQVLPVVQHHVSNHEQWLLVLGREAGKFRHFRGVALTGWSRYDHYATMCELLPTAIPSLLLCLKVWLNGSFSPSVHVAAAKTLGYADAPLLLNPYPRPQPVAQQLSFPGWKVMAGVEWFANFRVKFSSIVESDQVETWLNPWQIQNGFTNPMQIESIIPAFTDLTLELTALEDYLRAGMEDVLYPAAVEEWLGTRLEPLKVAGSCWTDSVLYPTLLSRDHLVTVGSAHVLLPLVTLYPSADIIFQILIWKVNML
ncbi:hexosaminidase D-like isoform X2 [Bacillus rossius redtenbacheri]|uniref:hexosaminidase D-like isoform X2 n=1 Tax=Bacillus rossius redtenbacheri TaxID=93214 RepID=UPI002FDD18C0